MNSMMMNIPAMTPRFAKLRAKAIALEANLIEDVTADSVVTTGTPTKAPSLWDQVAGLWKGRWAAPRQPTAAQEAEEVRALARSIADTDPGFASDLFAAAARHEARGG